MSLLESISSRALNSRMIVIAALLLLSILYFDVTANKSLFLWLNHTFHHDVIWQFFTVIGDSVILATLLLPIALRHKKFRDLIFLAAIICWAIVRIGKLSFAELRPLSVFAESEMFFSGVHLYRYSFPSGHSAAIATVIFSLISVFKPDSIQKNLLLGLVVVVAISRIMVGAHWPVDILAGILLGHFSVVVALLLHERFELFSSQGISFLSLALLFVSTIYVPWHKTGYPITESLCILLMILSIILSIAPERAYERLIDKVNHGKIYLLSILLVFIFFLFDKLVGWDKAFEQWKNITYVQLLALLTLTAFSYWVRAIRLEVHYREIMKGRITQVFWISSWHNFMNNLLPFRMGEITYPVLLKKHFDISYTSSLGTLLMFRILDIYAIFLLAILVVGYLTLPLSPFVALLMAYLLAPLIVWLVGKNILKIKYFQFISSKFLFGEFDFRTVLVSGFLSVLNWFLKLSSFSILIVSLSSLSWLEAFVGSVGGELSSVAPFHGLMGFGTYEAGVAAALSILGAHFGDAMLAAVNLHLYVLLSSFLSVLIAYAGFNLKR